MGLKIEKVSVYAQGLELQVEEDDVYRWEACRDDKGGLGHGLQACLCVLGGPQSAGHQVLR